MKYNLSMILILCDIKYFSRIILLILFWLGVSHIMKKKGALTGPFNYLPLGT